MTWWKDSQPRSCGAHPRFQTRRSEGMPGCHVTWKWDRLVVHKDSLFAGKSKDVDRHFQSLIRILAFGKM